MTRRCVIVLNPVSGRGSGARHRPELERLLRAASVAQTVPEEVEWKIVETTRAGEATALAARAAEDGAEIVAAAGGDGTLSDVLNGTVGTSAQLALLPLGTGNDFARTVGLYGNLRLAVDALFRGVPKSIDIGRVHNRYFLNVAGCGFDAVVAEQANRGPKWLTGAPAYVAAILGALASFRPTDLRLTLDGKTRTVRAMLCSIANARTYGGGMQIAPNAQLDDGLFDLCLLSECSKLEFLLAFPQVFRGTHTSHPKITMLHARTVKIESEQPVPLLVDGEVIGTTPAEFTICYNAIRFLFPHRTLSIHEDHLHSRLKAVPKS